MNIATTELKNKSLNYAVAKTLGTVKDCFSFNPTGLSSDFIVVLEAMKSIKKTFHHIQYGNPGMEWCIQIDENSDVKVTGKTSMEVICRAFLICNGVDSFDVPDEIAQ